MMKLSDAVFSALSRLDDEDCVVWSYDEMAKHIQDGYDAFCRGTKCLFDMCVIENVPPFGNWQTDLERYLAEHTPGMGLTDNRFNFTSESERDMGTGGAVAPSMEGPVLGSSSIAASGWVGGGPFPTVKIATGKVPTNTVDVRRVTWDELELTPEDSAHMRRLDIQYERREGGDPRMFAMDKDGLFTIRLVPPAKGDADYPGVVGSWGTMTWTDDVSVTAVGTWGILREMEGCFPANGPHGTVTRQHPAPKNIVVELFRLGRPLDQYPFEIPDNHVKYVIFYAMREALARHGPGQDLKLAKHFGDRFQMGVTRMQTRLKNTEREKVLKMGGSAASQTAFGMGDPTLPYPYGPPGRRIR